IQFHPTMFYHPEGEGFLISEAVRGAGAMLRNRAGQRFMPSYDDRAELAPRDIVARAIDDQMTRHGDAHVLLDMRPIAPSIMQYHFPTIHARCMAEGIDPASQPVPVV